MIEFMFSAYYLIGCMLVFNEWEGMIKDIAVFCGELNGFKMLIVFVISFSLGALIAPSIYLFERLKQL